MDVSFFVPVYRPNAEWLDSAVRSIVKVARLSARKVEILLGDDGSPESCLPLLTEYEKEFPGLVRAFRFPENRGIGSTSCALVDLASGRYVASFDQDDIMLPFDLDVAVDFLDTHDEYCASYARKFLFNDNGLTGDVHGDNQSVFLQFFQPKVNINGMLIRRDFLLDCGNFKPLPFSRINQDVWLMFRLAERGRLYFDKSEPRALYRVHQQQNSAVTGGDQHDFLLMGQDLICRNSELYRQIILEDFPEGRNEHEKRLIQGLCGLALFVNQRHSTLVWRIVEHARRAYPDDYGVREVLLQLLQSKPELFQREYEQAMTDFAGNADMQYSFVSLAARQPWAGEEIRNKLRELHRECRIAPPLVTDNLPKTKKASYSWSFSGFNI